MLIICNWGLKSAEGCNLTSSVSYSQINPTFPKHGGDRARATRSPDVTSGPERGQAQGVRPSASTGGRAASPPGAWRGTRGQTTLKAASFHTQVLPLPVTYVTLSSPEPAPSFLPIWVPVTVSRGGALDSGCVFSQLTSCFSLLWLLSHTRSDNSLRVYTRACFWPRVCR